MTTEQIKNAADLAAEFVKKMTKAETALRKFFREREDVIHGLALSAVTRHHILLLGPPGTAKSAIIAAFVRIFQCVIDDPRAYFRKLFSKGLPIDEVTGGLDIKELENGRYKRNVDGFLPSARFGNAEELYKGGDMNANIMLDMTDESRSFRNGDEDLNVPLEFLAASSNEVYEGTMSEAFHDRLAQKYWVPQMQEKSNFIEMLRNRADNAERPDLTKLAISDDELKAAQEMCREVEVPDAILEILFDLRNEFKQDSIEITNRHMNFAIDIVKGEAFLAGRMRVEADDLQVLQHVLWNMPDEIDVARKLVLRVSNPLLEEVNAGIDAARQEFKKARTEFNQAVQQGVKAVDARISATSQPRAAIDDILQDLEAKARTTDETTKTGKKIRQAIRKVEGTKIRLHKEILNIDMKAGA